MKTISLDSFLALLRGTVLHPFVSLLLPAGLILSGHERSPVQLGPGLASTSWVGGMSRRLHSTLWCVTAAWILSINRSLNRRALNPSPQPRPDLKNQVIVITGGATGIGALLAQKLDAAGATVVVLDVSPLSYTPGRRTFYIKCDVSEAAAMREAAANVTSSYGAPTMLVANAGIVRGRNILDATDQDLQLTFGVNVMGLLWTVRAFLPGMIAVGRGHVLITASATAYTTIAGVSDYSASKAAVNSLVEGLQTEVKHQHGNPAVAISALYPATIGTKMFRDLNAPDSLFLPILEPEDVAQRMFDILASGQRFVEAWSDEIYCLLTFFPVAKWPTCRPPRTRSRGFVSSQRGCEWASRTRPVMSRIKWVGSVLESYHECTELDLEVAYP